MCTKGSGTRGFSGWGTPPVRGPGMKAFARHLPELVTWGRARRHTIHDRAREAVATIRDVLGP